MSAPKPPADGLRTGQFSVPEMDCASCAGKVERSVTRVDGVDRVDPDVTTGRLTVTFDPEQTDEEAIRERVRRAGYSVDPGRREVTGRFTVPEMDCASCVQKVDKSVRSLDGVSIDANPTAGTVTVSYDPEEVSEDDVVTAIENAGYEVTGRSTEDGASGAEVPPPAEVWTSDRAIKTWVGAVALVGGLLFAFVLTGQNRVVGAALGAEFAIADVLFLVAIGVSGAPVVRSGYYSLRNRSLDIDLLMGTAIVAATGIGYFVEAATLAVLFSTAELLEEYAMDRARNSLRELMELSPEEATVRRDGEEVTVPVDQVEVGDTVVVRPGEKIPVDGDVVEGQSAVDESPITGESVPVDKVAGEEVYAGTINEVGYLEVEATSPADESTLSQIIELVQGAQQKQTEKEQFVDRFADYYTPTVVAAAILTAAVPPLAFGAPWETWFIRGLTLLVIACPCAFVISTPVSVVSGITSAAKNGVLIKGGNHLEAMGEVETIAFDKTGTLTKGELAVTDVLPFEGSDEADVLRIAAALEQRSEHPIGRAVVQQAEQRGVGEFPDITEFESLTGRGITASLDDTTYYVGNPTLFEELDVDLGASSLATDGGAMQRPTDDEARQFDALDPRAALSRLQTAGKTVILVGTGEGLVGVLGIADELKPEARQAIARLHEAGVRTTMLTGDNEGTARAIAEQVGIDDYRAELLPEEKVTAIEELREEYGDVAMVGDGVNDAPALATATVGVAMGAAGTDTALETADIALMSDDLLKLPYLYALSHRANGVIRQNIWTSLGVKALLAVGVPLGYVSVAVAVVVGDMGMSLGVTGNAMRLSWMKPDHPEE